MEAIGKILQAPESHQEASELDLRRLVPLPSTAELQASLANLQAQLTETRAKNNVAWSRLLIVQMERIEKDLVELAPVRDALLAERPEGCWCLGTGAKGERYTVEGVQVWDEYCPCHDGQWLKEQDQQEKDKAERVKRGQIYSDQWGRSELPSRFQRFSLSGFPISKATAPLVKALRCPKAPEGIEDIDAADTPAWDAWSTAINNWDRSWLFWGSYGRGKTGLAIAYAREWVKYRCDQENYGYLNSTQQFLFKPTPDLFSELRDTYRGHGEGEMELIKRYATVPLLVLDDLGAEHVKDSGWLEDRLYQIVNKRHGEELVTVFTSNLNLDQLAKKIGERVTWRIVEMCGEDHIIQVDGPNLRER